MNLDKLNKNNFEIFKLYFNNRFSNIINKNKLKNLSSFNLIRIENYTLYAYSFYLWIYNNYKIEGLVKFINNLYNYRYKNLNDLFLQSFGKSFNVIWENWLNNSD